MSLKPWFLFWLLLLCSIFLYLVIAQEVQAQVFITEVYPNPSSGESEWIEVYNSATESADLSGFSLYDTLSHPSLLVEFSDLIIAPLTAHVATISGSKLNNTGDTVVLYTDQQATASAMSYSSSEKGLSWNLTSLADQSVYLATPSAGVFISQEVVEEEEVEETQEPTPAAEDNTTNQVENIDTSLVSLSEIMACPSSGNFEWIEIYSEADISLENWILTDSSGNTRNLSGSIASHGYGVFEWSSSILNNTGDEISITTNFGELLTETSYENCISGKSLSLFDGKWQPTDPSPGYENIMPTSEDNSSSSETTVEKVAASLETQTSQKNTESSPSILGTSNRVIKPYYKSHDVRLMFDESKVAKTKATMVEDTPNQPREPYAHAILGGILVSLSSWLARK